MKNNRKKIYTVLASCILLCIVVGVCVYCIRNSTKNILIQTLYNKVEYGGEFNNELLINYNANNMDKLNKGKELSAEDYFFIAYEYASVKKDRKTSMKYVNMAEEKKGWFTNKFIELYNAYLMEYYYTYMQKDDSVLDKIDNELNTMTIKDWNKYGLMLNSKLALYIDFDGGFEHLINEAEGVLKNKEKLDARVIVPINDTLVEVYKEKGYHAKVLEKAIETKRLLKDFDIAYGDAYKARAEIEEAEVYITLLDSEKAESLLNEVLEMDIENDTLRRDIKVTALNKLISTYLTDGKIDKVPDLINKYNNIMNSDSNYNSDVLYYLSMAEYYMDKYEKDKLSEDLNKAEEYIKLSKDCFSGYVGVRYVNIDLYGGAYETYLEYLKGNVDYALDKYNEILSKSVDRELKIFILQHMCSIYKKEERYKEASEYTDKLLSVKNEESILINEDYSAYAIEKYENELAIRKMNEEKIAGFIKWFIVILLLTIAIVIVIMKNKTLEYKNITDSLTNINNRRYFNEVFNGRLEKNKHFYLFIFDIDNFKKINDTYGHLAGDEVLKRVAKVSKQAIGKNGIIFRYGGEEFVVIVNPRDKNSIINMAEDIRKRIEDLIWDYDMKVTISMGIADSAIEKERVLEVADSRLYTSKITGKNKITLSFEKP